MVKLSLDYGWTILGYSKDSPTIVQGYTKDSSILSFISRYIVGNVSLKRSNINPVETLVLISYRSVIGLYFGTRNFMILQAIR